MNLNIDKPKYYLTPLDLIRTTVLSLHTRIGNKLLEIRVESFLRRQKRMRRC